MRNSIAIDKYIDETSSETDIYVELNSDEDLYQTFIYNLGPYQGDAFFSHSQYRNIVHVGYEGSELYNLFLHNIPKNIDDYLDILEEIDSSSVIQFDDLGSAILTVKVHNKYLKETKHEK